MRIRKDNKAGLALRYLRALAAISAMTRIASAAPTGQSAGCYNKALLDGADAYVAAQTAGQLDPLKTILATDWKYQENNKEGEASKGVISKALKIDHRRTNVDTTSCATYTELTITDSANPYVIGTQLHHNTADAKIIMIDVNHQFLVIRRQKNPSSTSWKRNGIPFPSQSVTVELPFKQQATHTWTCGATPLPPMLSHGERHAQDSKARSIPEKGNRMIRASRGFRRIIIRSRIRIDGMWLMR
jgi:hypothetical protein